MVKAYKIFQDFIVLTKNILSLKKGLLLFFCNKKINNFL